MYTLYIYIYNFIWFEGQATLFTYKQYITPPISLLNVNLFWTNQLTYRCHPRQTPHLP